MSPKHIIRFCVVVANIGVVLAQTTGNPDVGAPQKRIASVELATRLLKNAAPSESQVPEGLRNPFDPTAGAKIESKSGRPESDKDLLALLAEEIHPTGVMGRDELVLLLKGQKGVKVNDRLTLSFDGAPYEVEITAIDSNNFSLRYNQAEITRPIKPGKNP